MDKDERQYHARELLNNPVFKDIMDAMEAQAVNQAVAAPLNDHSAHQAQLAYVRAIRTLRQDCEALLRNTPPVKPAPA